MPPRAQQPEEYGRFNQRDDCKNGLIRHKRGQRGIEEEGVLRTCTQAPQRPNRLQAACGAFGWLRVVTSSSSVAYTLLLTVSHGASLFVLPRPVRSHGDTSPV
eukprot:355524-Chlamydomonas_euryale.AAC.35